MTVTRFEEDGMEAPRVLVVDDSRSLRQSACGILEQAGCRVFQAVNGFDALCRLTFVRSDIVFMDIMMPELDGLETCALMRASAEFGELPVVLVSGNDGTVERSRADLAGARRYICKPFRRAELLAALQELLPQFSITCPEGGETAGGQGDDCDRDR